MSVRMWLACLQPTIIRGKTSMMGQKYATLGQVGTNVKSVTQSLFEPGALNSRWSRSR